MNRGEIRARVRIHIDELQEKRWKDVSLNSLINEAKNEVAGRIIALEDSHYTKDDTFTIEVNKELYDLPADFLNIKLIHDASGTPLSKAKITERSSLISDVGNCRYYFQGTQIGFWGIPTAAGTWPYWYVYHPPDIDTDVVKDSETFEGPSFIVHDLIAVLAAIDALDLDEEMDTFLIRKARKLNNRLVEIYYKRNSDFPEAMENDLDLEMA